MTRDANFPRAPVAERAGLHAAFGLPILQGTSVLGVMEFFSRDILEPTPALLAMMTTVGSQIGLYVERKWAGEELDRFFKLSLDLFCVAHLRRLLHPAQSRMAARARLLGGRAPRVSVHGLRPPGRPRRHGQRALGADDAAST